MKIRKAVFIATYALFEKEIKYLILKRKLHWKGWEFPKGGIKFFEPKRFSVRRELKEETGLSPIKITSFDKKDFYKYDKKHRDREGFDGQSYYLYSAEVKYSKNIKLDELEHSDYRWTTFEEAIKKLTWKNQKVCLKIINDSLKKKYSN